MIITCPACATRYLIDPVQLGPEGRRVRCAKCGHGWAQDGAPARPEPDVIRTPDAVRPIPEGSNLPAFPRPAPRRPNVIGWAALILVVAAVVAGGLAARERVVAAWPPSARLYAALGMPVLPLGHGIEFRDVAFERERGEDGETLVLRGRLANVADSVLDVPRLRVALIGKTGEIVGAWEFTVSAARLVPGETVAFVTRHENPPATASNLRIEFVPDP
ncbi:MAG: DUF3426 domain-containing protein [Alphaproteobacteria bacterium]